MNISTATSVNRRRDIEIPSVLLGVKTRFLDRIDARNLSCDTAASGGDSLPSFRMQEPPLVVQGYKCLGDNCGEAGASRSNYADDAN
jgi:hypothetical protein